MWDEISGLGDRGGSRNNKEYDIDNLSSDRGDLNENSSDNAFNADDFVPVSFGRSSHTDRGGFGSGGGRGRGNSGRGRGRGPEMNMKGPDWTCASCGNVNWSWRSNCNKCQTAKPAAVTVVSISDAISGLLCYIIH